MDTNRKISNIGLTITSLAPGGAEKQCLLLARSLSAHYSVFLVIIDDSPVHHTHKEFIERYDIPYIFLEGSTMAKLGALKKAVIEKSIDLIFSYLPRDVILTALAIRKLNVIQVGGIRNARMAPVKMKSLRFIHNKYLFRSISNSHSGKEFFTSKGFHGDKIQVIPNGIEINTESFVRDETKKIIISSCGRLVEQKDYPTAIRSFRNLLEEFDPGEYDVYLYIYGQGHAEEELLELGESLGLGERLQIQTNCTDIASVLKSSSIYLCTSIFEGLSNAIMEAMAQSLPIVATDAGDNNQLVIEGKNGHLLPQGDHIGIGNALSKLVRSAETRNSYGSASYRQLTENYSMRRFEANYIDFLENI